MELEWPSAIGYRYVSKISFLRPARLSLHTRSTTTMVRFSPNQPSPPPLRRRKRTLSVLGLLLPTFSFSLAEASPFEQHKVKRPTRAVEYEPSRRIPFSTDLSGTKTESKTQVHQHDEELWWFLPADAAVHESADELFERIRSGSEDSSKEEEEEQPQPILKRSTFPFSKPWLLRFRGLRSFPSTATAPRRAEDAFVDVENGGLAAGGGQPPATDIGQLNETVSVGFNVSAETDYGNDFKQQNASNLPGDDDSLEVFTKLINATTTTTPAIANNTGNSILSSKSTFRPLRMRAFLSENSGGGRFLTQKRRATLLESIIKPALISWSAALRVEPVVGNLTVDKDQLIDGKSCGPGAQLPSVLIPLDHLTEGVADTDFILYINLAFHNDSNSTVVTGEENDSTSSGNNATNQQSMPNRTTASGSSSVIDEDDSQKERCSGDYLAASAFCSTDQYDRPTAAILHLCIGEDFFFKTNTKTNIMIVLHEIGHALGFNAVSLAHFRRPDGEPYTARDPATGEIPITVIECTGPLGQRQRGNVTLPSTDILQFRTVRGGVRVAEVVTPFVRQVVRNHFDCQELPGAELESGEFLPLSTNPGEVSCLGDHWERRLFKTDLMNPIVDEIFDFNPYFSTVTLAYFADSGWYQVDLSRASLSVGWGRAAGCEFVDDTCIQSEDGQVPSTFNSFFCNQAPRDSSASVDIQGCTTDLSRKASCSMDSYDGELPPEYQYFSVKYGSNVGGTDPFMDYCPVYAGFTNGLCSDAENESLIKVNVIERFGRRNSRCLSGTLSRSSIDESTPDSLPNTVTEATALCLPIACVVEDLSLRIQVNGVWEVCHNKDDIVATTSTDTATVGGDNAVVSVVCPDPIRICPTFYCPRDCLGTDQICDYNVGKCICNPSTLIHFSIIENATSSNNFDSNDEECSSKTSIEDSFYQPDNSDESGLPGPESPLSDYYYPTERKLKEDEKGFWSKRRNGFIAGAASFGCLIFAFFCYWVVRSFPISTSAAVDSNGHDSPPNTETINPDKHKLMASVVVNLRMNDPNVRRQSNADSVTDLSMTDTERSGDQPSLEEFWLPPIPPLSDLFCGGTLVDFSGYDSSTGVVGSRLGLDDGAASYIDPLAPPSSAAPVVRRRHIFSNSFM